MSIINNKMSHPYGYARASAISHVQAATAQKAKEKEKELEDLKELSAI